MGFLDLAVIVAYLLLVTGVGWWAGRADAAKTVADFFLGGRKLTWLLLGTSMAATTLAADTPLTVAGITIESGVSGNWFWWSFIMSHVLVATVLAPLWRRADVTTDAEFCELRYDGKAAGGLRALKAFYYAVPINCFTMGWVMLAMTKVSAAVLPEVPGWIVVGVLLLMTLLYSLRSGFAAVVLTDLLQLPIALAGAVVLAWYSVDAGGGLDAVIQGAVAAKGQSAIALSPIGGESALPWHILAVFLAVQWWSWKNADGGGIMVQRMLAAKDERHAALGGLWFCFVHYAVRPWPWILTGLAALVVVPEVAAIDPERAYAALIVEVLPPGLRGLLVASFLAAFMSTMDTHLNWGASYVANDLVGRFTSVPAERLPAVSRGAVLGMAALAVVVALNMKSIKTGWEIAIAFGAGAGAPTLLRWFWWRITAEAEIAALLASGVISGLTFWLAPDWPWSARLMTVVAGSTLVWLPVALRTSRVTPALEDFWQRVRPPGPGWRVVAGGAQASGWPAALRWVLGVTAALCTLLGPGEMLLGSFFAGLAATTFGILLLAALVQTTPR
ncbi:MAG: SSS family solute:Na+ symporter [Myxococcota bacterium]